MSNDYIPSPDADFQNWSNNFFTYASAHAADLGLLPADILPLNDAMQAWDGAYEP